MLKKFSLSFLVIFILVALTLGACSTNNDEGKLTEKEELKIGILPFIDSFPIIVAAHNGYFDQKNLDVELVLFQSAVERDAALQAGQLDGTVSDLISTSLLKDSGLDIKIASITLGATGEEGPYAIVAAPNSNINSLSELKGKKIGISTNTSIEYVTDSLLKEAGLSPTEVEKTMVAKIPMRVEMLLNGQLDAATLPDPMLSFVEAKGAKRIADDTQSNLSQAVLIMTGKMLREKKDGAKHFIEAYSEAVTEINSNSEKYQELFVKETHIPDEIKDTFKVAKFSKPQLPTAEQVTSVIDWLKERDQLKTDLRYEDLIQKDLY